MEALQYRLKHLHGQGVLVVTVANVPAPILEIRTPVCQALSVMDVSITCGASERLGLGWVLEIDEDEAGPTSAGAGCSADGDGILLFLIDNNVVSAANGQVVPPGSDILLGVKGDGLLGVDLGKLAHIKHLDTVAGGLGSDDDKVLVPPDLTPDEGLNALGLRKTAEVDKLALFVDLGKGGAISLSDDDKLTAITAGPAPRGRTLASGGSQVSVRHEIVKVHLLGMVRVCSSVSDSGRQNGSHLVALERIHGIAGDDSRNTILAADGTVTAPRLPFLGVEVTGFELTVPCGMLLGHQLLVDGTTVINLGHGRVRGDFFGSSTMGQEGRDGCGDELNCSHDGALP